MNCRNLEEWRSTDVCVCDPDELADLRDVHIDTSLDRLERMSSFLDQVGNPYLFRVDGLVIKAVYPEDTRRLTEALATLLARERVSGL